MRAAITGARGFVGRHLAAHLQSVGDAVLRLDVQGDQPVDVTDFDALLERLQLTAPEVLYHLAARTHVGESWRDEEAVQRVNVDGTANVLRACVESGVSRVIVVGSAEQYGPVEDTSRPIPETAPLHPVSPYATSKARAEALALAASEEGEIDVVCVRAFNHTGPGQSPQFLVPGLAARIARAERSDDRNVAVGNLEPVRDYTDVRDVVRAYRLLAERGRSGTVYNVCSGHGTSVADIADGLRAHARSSVQFVVDPDLLRASDIPALVGDPARLLDATGWRPRIPLEQTLADVLESERARAG